MVARDFFTKERRGSENSGGGVMRVIFCADYAKRIDTEGGGGRQLHFSLSSKDFSPDSIKFPQHVHAQINRSEDSRSLRSKTEDRRLECAYAGAVHDCIFSLAARDGLVPRGYCQ